MTFGNGLPVSETIGVFVGVSGFDWLTDGRAEPTKAAIAAVAVGAVIYLLRSLLDQHRPD